MRKKKAKNEYRLLLGAILFACAALFCVLLLHNTARSTSAMQAEALEQSIRRAAVTCYAVEGRYPKSFSYLMENYGLTADFSQYAVRYTASGDNVMPDIEVIRIGGSP
jgi:hypothetical protein